MTVSLFRCYVTELEALRAERSLDDLQAIMAPHIKEDARKSWVERLVNAIKRPPEQDETGRRHFSWNGIWMGAKRLKRSMADAFGEAFRSE